ncbi:MAG: hypothetical protein JNM43_01955 [Planctomycetaceae bacterium]|nr:hypothetical protein [Planctomycetaceae bacterium]
MQRNSPLIFIAFFLVQTAPETWASACCQIQNVWTSRDELQNGEKDLGSQMIRENIYILRHARTNRVEQWAGAMRNLIRIGKPAVPEISKELDRPNRPEALRLYAFTLRAIDDPSCVPSLIRAIPESYQHFGAGSSVRLADESLAQFLSVHDLDPQNDSGKTITVRSADNELFATLESLTRHSSAELMKQEERRRVLRSERPDHDQEASRLFGELQSQWQAWWDEHQNEVLADASIIESSSGSTFDSNEDPIERAGRNKFGPLFPSGPAIRLGPILEAKLDVRSQYTCQCCIDLDHGKLFELREGIKYFPSGDAGVVTHQWYSVNGIDGIASAERIRGNGLHIWQIDNDRWNTIDDEISQGKSIPLGVERLNFQSLSLSQSWWEESRKPTETTYLFNTLAGSRGILQFPARSNKDFCVIRYRLWVTHDDSQPEVVASETQRSTQRGETHWLDEQKITLDNVETGRRAGFRFRDNSVVEIPEKLLSGTSINATSAWVTNSEIDLLTRQCTIQPIRASDDSREPVPFDVLCLIGVHFNAVPIDLADYEDLTVAEVHELIDRWPEYARDEFFLDGSPGHNLSGFLENRACVHAFRNQHGQCGMLEYSCPPNETKSITIRLKLEADK